MHIRKAETLIYRPRDVHGYKRSSATRKMRHRRDFKVAMAMLVSSISYLLHHTVSISIFPVVYLKTLQGFFDLMTGLENILLA